VQKVLTGKRVLITQATEFMGPMLCEVFAEQGAEVVASAADLSQPGAARRVVEEAGPIDVLVANLAIRAPTTAAVEENFVDNPTYFPVEVQANPRFQERLAREVPLGRLVGAREDAQFAAYLCSSAADCFVGQVFPVCGGWVAR
jgi:NAD(P)-dependent dehydrogenase (short-subunit alcohol dehydrogenase family)